MSLSTATEKNKTLEDLKPMNVALTIYMLNYRKK